MNKETKNQGQPSFEELKTQIAHLLEQTEQEFGNELNLNVAQQSWVQAKLDQALTQQTILKDTPGKGKFEDFTAEAKDALKPAIKLGLALKALENGTAVVRSHLQGSFYGEVQKRMQGCGVKQFRGFCQLTGYSHTTVYRKVKIAESYSREALDAYPGVDLKALYEVAVKKGSEAPEVLAKNHSALTQAGSDIHEVRKILNSSYERPRKPTPEIAISPDGRIKAEFYSGKIGKGKIVIVPTGDNTGVSHQDWADLQIWLTNQDCWAGFMAWKKLEEERIIEQEDEFDEASNATEVEAAPDDVQTDEEGVLTTKELFAHCAARWSDPKSREDDGNVNIAPEYGIGNLRDPGWLIGEVFIQYKKNGTENLTRETIFNDRFPLTSDHVKKQLELIKGKYPDITAVMFADKEEEFIVGTKMVNGTPVTRWGLGNA